MIDTVGGVDRAAEVYSGGDRREVEGSGEASRQGKTISQVYKRADNARLKRIIAEQG
jgi:hypothetical protein